MNAAQLLHVLAGLPGGSPPASPFVRGRVFQSVKFEDLTDEAKCQLAAFYIKDCCPYIGSVSSNGDAGHFLAKAGREFSTWPRGTGIASRRLEHIAFAVLNCFAFTTSIGALSATYLLHQLEFLFRALGGALTLDGRFVTDIAKASVERALGCQFHPRVNDIVATYRIMRLRTNETAVQICGQLDRELPHWKLHEGSVLTHIGERLGYFRHEVSHGRLADPSSEGVFYGLLITVMLYGSTIFARKVAV